MKPSEKVSAAKKLQRADARAILEASTRVVVAKGKRIDDFDTTDAVDEAVLDLFLGSTGNLRAPLARAGEITLVGFSEEAWSEALL